LNAFENEVHKSAVVLGVHYEKMPIPMKLGYRNGSPVLIKLKDNPYDGFIVHEGRHIPVEMKSQAVYGSFPLSNIETHQLDGLNKLVDIGCVAYLLFNQRAIERDGKKVSQNRAWALDFRKWNDLLKALGTRKSIPTELFESGDLLIEMPRIHSMLMNSSTLVWDIRMLTHETPHLYTSPEPWYRKFCPGIPKGNRKK
jgi:penicillin-binding protein-related factor A (putative recombinase)